jgi:hypothetical protein
MSPSDPTAPTFQASIGEEITQTSKVHINLAQDVIVTTEDRFRLCLQGHVDRLAAKERWLAPVSLFFTFMVVLVTSTFRSYLLPAETWLAIFVIGTFLTAIWSIIAIIKAARTDTKIDTLVREVKKSGVTQP